jgi:2-polyprenyl-3-methyl-5-hydroxy-6-metoxy-1,4-benzoquinol methylase
MNHAACPICSCSAAQKELVLGSEILREISSTFPDLDSPKFKVNNYKLLECGRCSFVFSDPMLSGNEQFYNWICQSKYYYPPVRWEWASLIEKLKVRQVKRVLDVGCGSGLFLDELRKEGLIGFGIDLNPSSVEACKFRGLQAECLTLEELERSGTEEFNAITLFHVLEHIESPVHSVKSLKKNLRPDGVIAVSVPLSPMSFETDWRDPLNRPPHHLSRWNTRSLQALAKAVDMNAEFIYQPPLPFISRVLTTLRLKHNLPEVKGKSKLTRIAKQLARFLGNPVSALMISIHQIQRDRDTGGAKGDSVLMILSGSDN